MIKTTLSILFLISVLLYIAEPKITFHPFKIQFAKGWFALGMMLIGFGIALVRYQGYRDGTKAGVDATFSYFKEVIKKETI
jgi:hypothetical protein